MDINDADALELTYDLVATTMQSHDLEYLLSRYMHKVSGILNASAASVRIAKAGELVLVDSANLPEGAVFVTEQLSIREFRERYEVERDAVGFQSNCHVDSQCSLVSVPLKFKNAIQGSYQFLIPKTKALSNNAALMLDNVGKHVGFLIEQARQDQDQARMLLVEERTRMANEMHDSLAQSLAGLRIQARILDETLHQGDEQVTWEELEKLQSQVEQANQELRCLIGRFRAPLQSYEVIDSVEKEISLFKQKHNANVYFQNEWQQDSLSADQRTDVIRIVQEALTNIGKHANASNVRVLLRHQSNRYRLMVEDDGEGFDTVDSSVAGRVDHFGQQIMSERALNLGGEFKVESEPGDGTRISLEFVDQ